MRHLRVIEAIKQKNRVVLEGQVIKDTKTIFFIDYHESCAYHAAFSPHDSRQQQQRRWRRTETEGDYCTTWLVLQCCQKPHLPLLHKYSCMAVRSLLYTGEDLRVYEVINACLIPSRPPPPLVSRHSMWESLHRFAAIFLLCALISGDCR